MELEAALHEHPDIAVVAAHAVPSELGEDEVKITAVLREGATLRESELFAWAQDRIPAFALPRYIEFREALPVSPLGKLLKYEMKNDRVTPATWDRVAEGVTVVKR